MANNVESDQLFAAKDAALEGFKETLLPLGVFTTDISPDEGEVGDIVKVDKFGDTTPPKIKARDGEYELGDLNATKVPVTMDQHIYTGWRKSDRDMAEMSIMKAEQWGRERGHDLAKAVLLNLLSVFTVDNFGVAIHTAGPDGFGVSDVIGLGKVLDAANWRNTGRSLILNGEYHGELRDDPRFDAHAFGSDVVRRSGKIPSIDTFDGLYKSPVIPDNGINLRGLCVLPDAVLAAIRYLVPEDPSKIVVAERLTDKETGITIGFRKWTDADTGASKTVLECLFGKAVGEEDAARLITDPA